MAAGLGLGAGLGPGTGHGATLPAPSPDLTLTVDPTQNRHPISEGVYGMSFAPAGLAAEIALPVNRWGGTATSRYNDTTAVTNLGADWYFENVTRPRAQRLHAFVNASTAAGARSLVSVPMLGWVARSTPAGRPAPCSYPKTAFPLQDGWDPWKPRCGNGFRAGTPLTANPATTSVPAGASWAGALTGRLVAGHGKAAAGGVAYYGLDNEPDQWHRVHRDVHPRPVTYSELLTRSTATAAAVKKADPTAKVLGPSTSGWCGYWHSAADGCTAGPDQAAHGGTSLTGWYLRQFRTYAKTHGGQRLLDYLDLHYTPAAAGVAGDAAGDAATQARRLRSTRALWDPTFVDASSNGTPVRLIPRMKAWVNAEYPGTGLAISQYSFGALGSLNGALTQADALGILGREGVDLAALATAPTSTQPGAFAFRMFRNYDGRGSRFASTSVSATSPQPDVLAVYAAQRADRTLTVLIVNKSTAPVAAATTLAGQGWTATAQRYTYSGTDLSRIVRGDPVSVVTEPGGTASGWTTSYPASSLTLLVLSPAG